MFRAFEAIIWTVTVSVAILLAVLIHSSHTKGNRDWLSTLNRRKPQIHNLLADIGSFIVEVICNGVASWKVEGEV